MKIWFISLAISLVVCTLGLVYFVIFIAQDKCLDSGGRWLGVFAGCEGGSSYALENLLSPLGIAIFLGIVLGICSALVQFYSLLFRNRN